MKLRLVWGLVIVAGACSPRPAPAQDPVPALDSVIPEGRGQLAQEVITLQLRSGNLEIRFTPLDERVTRLLAPDAWRSLQDLVTRNAAQVDSVARRAGIRQPGLVLVSFYALAPDTRFDPNLLTVSSHNRILRPADVIPLSASFSAQQLGTRERAMGLYIYEDLIPVNEPFGIEYLGVTTNEWERRLPRFDRERARIQSRSGGGQDEDR